MESPRSVLAAPGSSPRMIAKALASEADAIFLDLEDAVASAAKNEARTRVIEALLNGDWGSKRRTIRINPVASRYCYRDIVDVVEGAGDRIDAIVVPKVDSAADIHFVDALLGQVEQSVGREIPIRLEAQIESATGLVHCEEIAACSPRLDSLIFGPGDFASSAGMPADNLGTFDRWDMAYGGHRWHYAMSRIVVAARANGLRPIDGPHADFRDQTGLSRSCLLARALGFDGKWCIHPSQIETVTRFFSPSAAEVERARAIEKSLEMAEGEGRGAAALDGQMLDAASVKIARRTLERARELGLG